MKIFAAPKKFENFRSEARWETRQKPQAAPCQCSADLVRTRWSAAEVGRRPAGLISARSRTISDEKFCGSERKFGNFRSETRWKTRQNSQAASCRCSADLVRTRWSAVEVGRRPAGLISARSRTISDEKFCSRPEKSRKFTVRNAFENATKPAGRVVPVLGRPCAGPVLVLRRSAVVRRG